MSRFGSTAKFYWRRGDIYTGIFTITLSGGQMPQYPFTQNRITDEKQLRTLSGGLYSYRNYQKYGFIFKWSNIDESKRNEIANMADQMPIFSFYSGNYPDGNDFGTFQMVSKSFKDKETSFELYDISFKAEEDTFL